MITKWTLTQISVSSEKTSIIIENEQIRNSSREKLLGVFFDSKLTFESNMTTSVKKHHKN